MEEKREELDLVTNEVAKLEMQLQAFKVLEEQYKQMKEKLFQLMKDYDVKSTSTQNGISIVRYDAIEDKIVEVEEFNTTLFKEDYPELYEEYVNKVTKINKGKKGYVKITLPKVVDYSRLNGGNE